MNAKITLVGCGFLGSLFAEEVAKRWFAFEDRLGLLLVDDDTVDERNPANHLFTPRSAGGAKTDELAGRLAEYPNVAVEALSARVDATHPIPGLDDYDLLVDAVDNLPTRQWLWELGIKGTPVLHLGVSQVGTGAVEWTLNDYDTFGLSPVALMQFSDKQQAGLVALKTLKPCELIAFRGLGLNVALAGAKAAGIAFNIDPEHTVEPHAQSALTSWTASNLGHSLREVERVS